MNLHLKLLHENKAWANRKLQQDPNFFKNMADVQSPEFLWIGCSDSRVPANEITGTAAGEVFVHRNIANMVVHTDMNLLSVLEYAVNVLKVKHVIVCGHYGCGGVRAAMMKKSFGIINEWLLNIKNVMRIHEQELNAIETEEAKLDRLIELNIQEQVLNLAKTSIIQSAWFHDKIPHLHGWVYSIANGILKPVFDMPPGTRLDAIYEYDNL
jgi:carbonic anhydrase